MTIIRGLCIFGVQLVYFCSKCEGVWVIKEDLTIPDIHIGVASQRKSLKTPRYRTSSK